MRLRLTAKTASRSVLHGLETGALFGSAAGMAYFLGVALASATPLPTLMLLGAFAGLVWGAVIGGYAGLAHAEAVVARLNDTVALCDLPGHAEPVASIARIGR